MEGRWSTLVYWDQSTVKQLRGSTTGDSGLFYASCLSLIPFLRWVFLWDLMSSYVRQDLGDSLTCSERYLWRLIPRLMLASQKLSLYASTNLCLLQVFAQRPSHEKCPWLLSQCHPPYCPFHDCSGLNTLPELKLKFTSHCHSTEQFL